MALGRDNVNDLYPEEVAKGITEGKILLVDVREPSETDVERYPEARLHADVGIRSGGAARSAGQAGRVRLPLRQSLGDGLADRAERRACPTTTHLAGGIKAWKEAGLPTET